MKEFIFFGLGGEAAGQGYMPQLDNRYCAVLTGGAKTGVVSGSGNTTSVDWSVAAFPRADFGRFADAVAGGIWGREEGYYFVTVAVKVTFANPITTGYFTAILYNSYDSGEITRTTLSANGLSELAFDMSIGDFLPREGYFYLQFNNNSGENCDVDSRAFVMKVG